MRCILLIEQSAIFVFLSLIICSSGSVQQMIPPAPLGPGGYRGNLVVSYDLNNFGFPASFGMNFYWGVGKEYNLGFGYQPPIGISHITAVKYYDLEKKNQWNIHASLNGLLFTSDRSPNMEAGLNYVMNDGSSLHTLSTGLWVLFDDDTAEPIYALLGKLPLVPNPGFKPRPRPFLGYDFSHDDTRFAVRNTFGFTKRAVNWDRRRLDNQPTILLKYSDIRYFPEIRSNRNEIVLNDRSRYTIFVVYPGVDAWGPDLELMYSYRFSLHDSIEYHRVALPNWAGGNGHTYKEPKLYELNFDTLWSDYSNKKDIVIGPRPDRTPAILNLVHWYKHDWSIAFGHSWGK